MSSYPQISLGSRELQNSETNEETRDFSPIKEYQSAVCVTLRTGRVTDSMAVMFNYAISASSQPFVYSLGLNKLQ